MPREYFLYTVRGLRELYYAAVDCDSGQVWTAPTKDVADRFAREAGLDVCKERTISKDDLMRSLGLGGRMKPNRSDDTSKPKSALFTDYAPPVEESKSPGGSAAPWFMPGAGDDGSGTNQKIPALPGKSSGGKKSGRGGRKGSPFVGGRLIIPGPIDGAENSDDVLMVPSSDLSAAPRATFSDQIPPVAGEMDEDNS